MTKKLSDRIREIEAGPWAIVVPTLIAEIEKLERQLDAANTLINKYREETTSLRQQLLELQGMREEVLHYQREFHKTRDHLAESKNLRAGIEMGMDCANAEAVRLRQQVKMLRDALKQARHMIYYGEPQIGWNITRIDEVLAATKEN